MLLKTIPLRKVKNWIEQIDGNTELFKSAFGHLSGQQLNWKPNPQSWSIAQNLDHLIVINSSYFPVLMQMRAGNNSLPWISRLPFLVEWMGNMILKAVEPSRRQKTKTFPIWEPATSKLPADILSRFLEHQEVLKAEVNASRSLVEAGAILTSPANKYIVYKLETAFDLIVAHELRHLAQAQEVLKQMKTEVG